ncbi:MAG: nitronate monooxygenase [Pseudomonadales bacterium]|nr:nitronate monooxygenase [Pseudomonadales bacterium]
MKTKFTELFGIQYPVVLSGMSKVAVPKLVAAVSNAGGLGILATGPLSGDETRAAIREIRSLTDKPFGIGVTLIMPGAVENAQIGLEEKVPVINFSLGKGDWIAEQAHAYGGKVIATVVNERHAMAAQRHGADAVFATGYEAAAHGGPVTSMVLIPSIVDAVDIPVIGAGGFADGRGLVAALALGAQGIAMGSRFSITQESPIHDNTKQTVIGNAIEDTFITEKLDGMDCRVMKSPAAEKMDKASINLMAALKNSFKVSKSLGVPWVKVAVGALITGPEKVMQLARSANASEALDLAIKQGDVVNGVHLVGQVQGRLKDTPTVAEVMQRVIEEAESVKSGFS